MHYENTIAKDFHNDSHVIFHLAKCYYCIKKYNKVVFYAEKVKIHLEFKRSKAQFFLWVIT